MTTGRDWVSSKDSLFRIRKEVRLHADRIVGGDCGDCDSRRNAFATPGESESESKTCRLFKQHATGQHRLAHLRWGICRTASFTNENDTIDFTLAADAHENVLKLLVLGFVSKESDAAPQVYICPGAQAGTKPAYAPNANSCTALILSQLVLQKGFEKIHNPVRTVVIQENYVLMNTVWYEPEIVSDTPDTFSQWHTWTASPNEEWSGPPGREHYNNLHGGGGNLIWCDGHADFRFNKNTSSLDWGLLDLARSGFQRGVRTRLIRTRCIIITSRSFC